MTPLLEPRPAAPSTRTRAGDPAILLRRTHLRQALLFLLICLALVGVAGRLVYWQVAQGGALAARANAEHVRTLRIAAGRGSILDANGRVLALDVTKDTLIVDPALLRQLGTQAHAAARLSDLLGLPLDLVRRQVEVPGAYVRLADASGQPLLLTPDQSHNVSVAIAGGELAGVALYPTVLRVYPEGSAASQVLGFVRASDGVGQYGVEAADERVLAGQPGLLTTAVDAAGDPLADGPQSWTPPVPGANVTLTVDAVVQDMAERELADAVASTGASGGTVIVLDPHSGAILALANSPAFDPNDYAAAPLSAFTDPGVSGLYDPGSVMKAVTMAAGIDTGVITPDTSFYDAGTVQVGGTTLRNWNSIAWGQETMTQVLAHSANVGAVWVEQRIGQARFESYLARFGFGARTGVGLPDESAGLVPRPGGASEEDLTLAEQSFGESIGVTPLQMAAVYGALANGGVLMRPYIVQCVTADGGLGARTCAQRQAVRRVVSAATAATVTQMLEQSDQYGEAQMHLVAGYSVAAKTGTATPDPSNPSLTYASVIGYAPASSPRFVILFKLDHPQTTIFGGLAAGPFWRALAEQLFIYYRVPPDQPVGSG